MYNQLFHSYTKFKMNSENHEAMLALYVPIVGPNAYSLYLALHNSSIDNKNANPVANTINSLLKSINIKYTELLEARKILEATGLLRTYISNDENKFAFEVIAPLSPNKFLKNKLLKNLLLRKIGEVRLDNIMHLHREIKMDLDDYNEVTANFQDLFDIEELSSSNNIELIREMQLPQVESMDHAIESMDSKLFFKYLTKSFPSPIQINKINALLESGLSNPSLNLILNHSYEKNGAIIFNYVTTIANDFQRRQINTFMKIKESLSQSKKHIQIDFFGTKNEKRNTDSLKDIFKGMFSN